MAAPIIVRRLPRNENFFKDIVLFHHFREYNILKCSPFFPWNLPRVPTLRHSVIQMEDSECAFYFSALPRIPPCDDISFATTKRHSRTLSAIYLPLPLPLPLQASYPNPHDCISLWNSKKRTCHSTGLKSVLLRLWKTPCTLPVVCTSIVCTWSYIVLPATPFDLEQESKALPLPRSFIKSCFLSTLYFQRKHLFSSYQKGEKKANKYAILANFWKWRMVQHDWSRLNHVQVASVCRSVDCAHFCFILFCLKKKKKSKEESFLPQQQYKAVLLKVWVRSASLTMPALGAAIETCEKGRWESNCRIKHHA